MYVKKVKYTIWKIISSKFSFIFFSKFKYGLFLLNTGRKKIKNYILYNYFSDFVVKKGPFSSMRLVDFNFSIDSILPKVSGFYEFEIHRIINRIIEKKHSHIINIGCAEGYYLVGFALKISDCQLIGFDSDVGNQELCRQNSALNSVSEKIQIYGHADESSILKLKVYQNMLFFSDCEGAELDIFTERVIKKFRNSDFLIETHDCYRLGLTNELKMRFESTHDIQTIDFITNDRRVAISSISLPLSRLEKFFLLEERREKDNGWIYCEAKK
jgi:hypothetical protein